MGSLVPEKDDWAILEDPEFLPKAAFLTPSLVPTEQPASYSNTSGSSREGRPPRKLGWMQGEVCKP